MGQKPEISSTQSAVSAEPISKPKDSDPNATLAEIEKQHILTVLEHSQGNRTRAAKQLDISIRTLRNKLNEYGYKNLPESPADQAAE
jgi:DNA-binding NtrC family response regulator